MGGFVIQSFVLSGLISTVINSREGGKIRSPRCVIKNYYSEIPRNCLVNSTSLRASSNTLAYPNDARTAPTG